MFIFFYCLLNNSKVATFYLISQYDNIIILILLMHGLRNQIFTLRLRVLYLQYKIVLSIQEIIKNTYAV
jgi:hypothetical protein